MFKEVFLLGVKNQEPLAVGHEQSFSCRVEGDLSLGPLV